MKINPTKKIARFMLPLLVAVALVTAIIGNTFASTVPVISIDAVETDKSVTISGANFPVDQKFVVLMGEYGTYALDGIRVGRVVTTADTFTATFEIPEDLLGAERIAIRLDSEEGYYSYNWFYNTTAPIEIIETEESGYAGYPTFIITDVERNTAVDIKITNLPENQTFTVKMGEYMTRALEGIEAGSFESGAGGDAKLTFTIPADLADLEKIAIRFDSPEGYYAYNWFWNNSTGTAAAGEDVEDETAAYTGIPTIHIDAVERDTSVTLSGMNFPAGETFQVTMGAYGTKGIDGIEAGSYESVAGGDFGITLGIPAELAGSYRIAIRFETESGIFYAYNWFYNNTTE